MERQHTPLPGFWHHPAVCGCPAFPNPNETLGAAARHLAASPRYCAAEKESFPTPLSLLRSTPDICDLWKCRRGIS